MSTVSITIVFHHGNPIFNYFHRMQPQHILHRTRTLNIILMSCNVIMKTIPSLRILILGTALSRRCRMQVLKGLLYNLPEGGYAVK